MGRREKGAAIVRSFSENRFLVSGVPQRQPLAMIGETIVLERSESSIGAFTIAVDEWIWDRDGVQSLSSVSTTGRWQPISS